MKCEHYWPLDAQPFTHGYLQVTLVGEEVAENWAVRNLKLCHVSPAPLDWQFLPCGGPSPELPRKSRFPSLPPGTSVCPSGAPTHQKQAPD